MALSVKYTRRDMHVIIHPTLNLTSTLLVKEAHIACV